MLYKNFDICLSFLLVVIHYHIGDRIKLKACLRIMIIYHLDLFNCIIS